MADGRAHDPRSSPQPAQTMSSVSRRDASLEVQHPLRNEQEDNLEQSNKNAISTFLLFRTVNSRQPGVEQCRTGVSACHCLQPGLQKPIDICESIAAACMHLPPFLLGLV